MSPHGLPLLVIVSGAPGAGKTTLARRIAAVLALPLLCKDDLKEAIGDELGPPADVAASQLWGHAAYRVLYSTAARFLDSGVSVAIESNFRRGLSERELQAVAARADARLVHCTADPNALVARYTSRYGRGERHPVHLDADRADGLVDDLAAGRFEPVALDIPALVVRTDDGYEPGLEKILAFVATTADAAAPLEAIDG